MLCSQSFLRILRLLGNKSICLVFDQIDINRHPFQAIQMPSVSSSNNVSCLFRILDNISLPNDYNILVYWKAVGVRSILLLLRERGVPRSRLDQRARRTVRIGTLGSRAKRIVRTNDLDPRAVSLCANIFRMLVTTAKSLKQFQCRC